MAFEMLGISPMGSSMVPAEDGKKGKVAEECGRLVMEVLDAGPPPELDHHQALARERDRRGRDVRRLDQRRAAPAGGGARGRGGARARGLRPDRVADPAPVRPQARRPLRGHRPLPRGRRAARDQAAEGARRPARGRAHGDRADDRRGGRRRRGGGRPGRGAPGGPADQAERRLRDPARQPGARGLRGEALRPRPHGAQRPGARVRARGGRLRGRDGEGRSSRATWS